MNETKRRTIAITGPFAGDELGDLKFVHPGTGMEGWIEASWIRTWPGVTVTVEDAPPELPTHADAVIRATVTDRLGTPAVDQDQDLDDTYARLWRAIGGALDGGWFPSSDICDDWVEPAPATS